MNLKVELQKHRDEGLANRPEEINTVMATSAQKLIDDKIGKNALKKGGKLPEFTLENATGQAVNIYDILKNGPLIINFYRGAWCPYCNLELRAYKELLPEIIKAGGNLVAISPELPDTSMTLIEKHGIEFQVLSDIDNKIAKELGLVFKLDHALVEVYNKFGIDLDTAQGNMNKEVPLPATYVIGSDGIVLLASVDTDYTKRLEPTKALEAIKANK